MCGRFEFTQPIGGEFSFVDWIDVQPNLDIKPTNPSPVILLNAEDDYELQIRRWGFIRVVRSKTGKLVEKPFFNARSEKIHETRAFAKAYESRRCIIPMNAWIEWPEIPEINNGEKTRCRIFMPSRPTFGAAGVYEDKVDKETGEVTQHFSMLTVSPGENSPIKDLHNRSPLILQKDSYDTWLRGQVKDADKLLRPYPDQSDFAYTAMA